MAADPGLVVVAGEAGIGKTALLRAVVGGVGDRGGACELVAATSAARVIPFGAMAHLLGDRVAGELEAAAGRGEEAAAAVMRVLLGGLRLRGQRGLVMGIDDIDLLDGASAVLVSHLVRSGQVTVIATVRSGETVPEPVRPQFDDAGTRKVTVGPLSHEAVGRLAARLLEGPVDVAVTAEVWRCSRGNPLVAVQTVASGREGGMLVSEEGRWVVRAPLEASVSIDDVVRGRLECLDADEFAAAELVAFGEPLELAVAERLADDEVLERLERRRVVRATTADKRVALTVEHPVFAEALRSDLPHLRRRALARCLATELQQVGARRFTDPVRQATWLLEAGGPHDPEVFASAARRALAVGDAASSVRFAAAAVARTEEPEPRITLGEALALLGHRREAEEHFVAVSAGNLEEGTRAHLAIVRARNLFWGLRTPENATEVLATSEKQLTDSDLRDQLASMRATMLLFGEQQGDALTVARKILDRPGASQVTRVLAFVVAQLVWMLRGHYSMALADGPEWLGFARSVSTTHPLAVFQIESVAATCLALLGSGAQGHEELRRHFDNAVLRGDPATAALWGVHAGWYALAYSGILRDAATVLKDAEIHFDRVDPFGHLALHAALLAEAQALLGNDDEATRALRRYERYSESGYSLFRAPIARAIASMEVARGELARGVDIALAAADRARATREVINETLLLDSLARWGHVDNIWERLCELAELADGPVTAAMAQAAASAAHDRPIELFSAAETLEGCGWMLCAADHFAIAARLLRSRGQLLACARAIARARRLYATAGTIRTPAGGTLAVTDPMTALTPRERQIALLTSPPETSNAEIAQKLSLSERTVANHLGRTYRKTGAKDRGELSKLVSILNRGGRGGSGSAAEPDW